MSQARLMSVTPKMAARDIAVGVAFYVEKLGFARAFEVPGYAGVSRDGVTVHLWQCDDERIAHNTGCRVWVENIEALYAEYQAASVIHPNGPLTSQEWGVRDFSVLDHDGNLLTFEELLSP